MKRDAPDEETDGSVLEAANAAAKRVASKWDIAPAEGEAAAAPPAGLLNGVGSSFSPEPPSPGGR